MATVSSARQRLLLLGEQERAAACGSLLLAFPRITRFRRGRCYYSACGSRCHQWRSATFLVCCGSAERCGRGRRLVPGL
jgi:hypothetical protein